MQVLDDKEENTAFVFIYSAYFYNYFFGTILLETSTVSSVDGKQRCSALHIKSFIFFHWLKETVRVLVKWVVFLVWVPLSPEEEFPTISQVTSALNRVWTKHVAVTSDVAFITALKLGISIRIEGFMFVRTAVKKKWRKKALNVNWIQCKWCQHVLKSAANLLSQTLNDLLNAMWLWLEMHIKLEPDSHSFIAGLISLLRLKVFSVFSTLCSFFWICAMFKGRLSSCQFTDSLSGKKPLSVQISLTCEDSNSPSHTGCNVMFGETTRCPEIGKRLFICICSGCGCFLIWPYLTLFSRSSNTYLQIVISKCNVVLLS